MSKFLLNRLVQFFSISCQFLKINQKIKNLFPLLSAHLARATEPAHWPVRSISPRLPRSRNGLRVMASQLAQPPGLLPHATAVLHAPLHRTKATAHLGAMAESRVAAPSPLLPPLLATFISPSSGNRQPSMAPHHRLRPTVSPPSDPYKRAPRPHLTQPQPLPPFSPLVRVYNALPTACLWSLPLLTIARPPHRRPASGERPVGSPVLHSPSPTPWPLA
jgi:hypothetical protein